MLLYSYENLKRITETEAGKKVVNDFERIYKENYENVSIPTINYSYAKLIYQNGNRNQYEKLYFDKRKRLTLLQVLTIADDKWLDLLEEVLATICDEFTWVLPAHNLMDDKTFDYTYIDLFSAETGFYLAETAYILKDKLSADIQKRIKISLENKIVKNMESRTFKFDSNCSMNWASVCSCGVGLTYLYAFPERFPIIQDRIFSSFHRYLNGIGEDGYCFEGTQYWFYGFGFFSIFFDVYKQLTGEWHPILNETKVRKTLQYFEKTRIDETLSLPFADGGGKVEANPWYFYTIKNLFEDSFTLPVLGEIVPTEKVLGARILNGVDRFANAQTALAKKMETIYYPTGEVFIHKNAEYCFVAKGGTNGEFHNHNDVGVFQLVKNGKRLIADLGAGEYTRGYFMRNDSEEGRYGKKIFVCGSFSHSVPIVDGLAQKFNSKEYKSEVLNQTEESFSLDISKAYGLELGRVLVNYQMEEKGIKIKYTCKAIQERVIFRFVSDYQPQCNNGTVEIEGVVLANDRNIQPNVEKVGYNAHNGEKKYAYTIDYKIEGEENVEANFSFAF